VAEKAARMTWPEVGKSVVWHLLCCSHWFKARPRLKYLNSDQISLE